MTETSSLDLSAIERPSRVDTAFDCAGVSGCLELPGHRPAFGQGPRRRLHLVRRKNDAEASAFDVVTADGSSRPHEQRIRAAASNGDVIAAGITIGKMAIDQLLQHPSGEHSRSSSTMMATLLGV